MISVTAAATSAAAACTVEVATTGGFVLVANVNDKIAVGFIAAIGFLKSDKSIQHHLISCHNFVPEIKKYSTDTEWQGKPLQTRPNINEWRLVNSGLSF